MEEELITVVVPIYRVEKYLVKCIDSIIEQSYKNIELILVARRFVMNIKIRIQE